MSNPYPKVYERNERTRSTEDADPLVLEVFDLIRDIKDPEHPHTLEELNVVSEECISLDYLSSDTQKTSITQDAAASRVQGKRSSGPGDVVIRIEFTPTVPHCSLATMIGLCIRMKLERTMIVPYKLDVVVVEGTHSIEEEVNKQINDKERVAAAMENPGLRDVVEECIKEVEY